MYSKKKPMKSGFAKYFRNADAPWGWCIGGLIGGFVLSDIGFVICNSAGFNEIFKNGAVVVRNPLFWIGLGLNFAFNVVFYLSLTCVVSKISPPVRRHGILMKLLAVLSWIVAYCVYTAFRSVCAELLEGTNHFSIWYFLFLYETCRGLWRWIVGVRADLRKDELAAGDTAQYGSCMNKSEVSKVVQVGNKVRSENKAQHNVQGYWIIAAALVVMVIICACTYYLSTRYQIIERDNGVYRVNRYTGEMSPVTDNKRGKIHESEVDLKDANKTYQLGLSYFHGRGVEQSDAEAVKLFRIAAEACLAEAQLDLARMYLNGRGVEKDEGEAFEWCQKAAVKGFAPAQLLLYYAYAHGRGVARDEKEALRWCRRAAEQGSAVAQKLLAMKFLLLEGDENWAESTRWYRKAAEQGDLDSQYELGEAYYKGRGVERDEEVAAKWYLEAAKRGHMEAQFMLGMIYINGKDNEVAMNWVRKAAEQGHKEAQYLIGAAYFQGQIVERSDAEAEKWLLKAAKQDHADAQYMLGILYGPDDENQADYWLNKAAAQGHKEAKRVLREFDGLR